MGHFAMTCSISGLSISGGTAVRCLLLTATPYVGDDPRKAWIVRTPPIRAEYNDYGSIQNVHADDQGIAQLWTRGLREDVVEKGLGDNLCHDVPVPRDMTFEEMLAAIQEGRLEVRRDVQDFWRRPIDGEDRGSSMRRRIEEALEARFPGSVSRHAAKDKYVVDEPILYMVRVRYGEYQHGSKHSSALHEARVFLENMSCVQDRFVCCVTAGSGRYANEADLLVFSAPAAKGKHVTGPQWDMGPGQVADENKTLRIGLAMIREDVWQALIAYPHSEYVALPCVNCGQSPAYHKDVVCPTESINRMPYKEHSKGTTYAHASVFSDAVPHFFQQRWSEYVWYGIEAFKAVTRATWKAVLARLRRRYGTAAEEYVEPIDLSDEAPDSAVHMLDDLKRQIEEARRNDKESLAAMSSEDRAVEEAKRAEARACWDAEERRKRENPLFGDFLIRGMDVGDWQRPGAWVFHDSTPGVIGLSEHLSMLVADKTEASDALLDAIAELSAVRCVISGVGVVLRPAASTGPQDPEWCESVRFLRTLLSVAEKMAAGRVDDELEGDLAFATYAEAAATLGNKAFVHGTSSKRKLVAPMCKKSPAKRKLAKKARAKTPRRK